MYIASYRTGRSTSRVHVTSRNSVIAMIHLDTWELDAPKDLIEHRVGENMYPASETSQMRT